MSDLTERYNAERKKFFSERDKAERERRKNIEPQLTRSTVIDGDWWTAEKFHWPKK